MFSPNIKLKMLLIGISIFNFQFSTYAQEQDSTVNRDLEQVVVTATRSPKTLKSVPVVTRFITEADIKKVDATNVQDLLTQELPGLEFTYSMNQQTSINLSGFGGNSVLFLVDGERLANLMIEHNFCVTTRKTFEIKAIDTDALAEYQDD